MTPQEQLRLIFQRKRWAAEELVYDQKLQEANEMCNLKKNQPVYDYLLERYGSQASVLAALSGLLRLQDGPRKALAVRKDK